MKIGRQRGGPVILKDAITPKVAIGWIIRIAILVGLLIFGVWAQNNLLIAKKYIFMAQKVPKTFVGYTIVHVSDLNNTGLNVYSKVKSCDPDIIIVSGGFCDDRGRCDKSVKTVNKLGNLAPTYYVLGESDVGMESQIISSLNNAIYAENDVFQIYAPEIDSDKFIKKYIGNRIIGLANKGNEDAMAYIQYTQEKLNEDANALMQITGIKYDPDELLLMDGIYDLLGTDKEVLQVAIANQPKLFNSLSTVDIDIIFSGQLHGDKTKLPNYSKGMYAKDGTTMFLSGGIGNLDGYSNRLFNFPEVVSITLSDGTIKQENPIEKLLGYLMPDVKTRFDNDGGFKEYTYTYSDNYGKSEYKADP